MFVIHLNGKTIKTLLLQILVIKMIFSRKLGGINFFSSTCGQKMSLFGHILLPKQWFKVTTFLFRPKPYLKTPSACYFVYQKFWLLKKLKFWRGLSFLRCGWLAILKYVKTSKMVKNVQFLLTENKPKKHEA